MAETVTKREVSRARTSFRLDIQGLRALAVGAVLLYHANFPFLRGGFVGVDVFFVISGFLITGLLMREALNTGRINLWDFYAKRIRRIIPAATIVLSVTFVLTIWILPEIRWESVGSEIVASALYVVNWVFAANTDYLNADVAASPLQHFWTLAVEEQFYIIWPLILIAILLVVQRRRHRAFSVVTGVRRYAGIGVMFLLIPSLAWSVIYTEVSPAPAYFITTTRLWELAIGAAVAVFAVHAEQISDWCGFLLGWFGLAAIMCACVLYSESTSFPGIAALLPTLGAAAVIIGGMNGRANRGVGALLSLRPMRWVGDISYSLYLWHWPLIVVGTYLLDGELRFRYGLLIVAFSVLPAWLSYRYIENPFRNWEKLKHNVRASLASGGVLMLVSVLLGSILFVAPGISAAVGPDFNSSERLLGAAALESNVQAGEPVDSVVEGFVPSAIDAREDNPIVYENGCHAAAEEVQAQACTFGDLSSDIALTLVGDSHAASWVPALIEISESNNWALTVYTKSACSFADAAMVKAGGAEYKECTAWNSNVLEKILEDKPDLVVTTNSAIRDIWDQGGPLTQKESADRFAEGLHRTWTQLNDANIPTIAIRDTPQMGIDIPECVSGNPNKLTECAVSRTIAIEEQPKPELAAQGELPDTEVIDMNDWICPLEYCSPIIGNVLVWRDAHHLTATYSLTLAGPLERSLKDNRLSAAALSQ